MEIRHLIDQNYYSLSILEDMQQIAEWLQQQNYYAIVDEELKTVGIVTAQDFVQHQHSQLIDHDFTKPSVRPDQNIREVFEVMKSTQSSYLPVFDGARFVGVVSLWSLTERLLKLIGSLKAPSVSPAPGQVS